MTNAIGTNAIGPSFLWELTQAGVNGGPYSWDNNGNFNFYANCPASMQASVLAVYAAHNPNRPDPYALTQQLQQMAIAIQIASTGNPALNGTYALDDPSRSDIDGIYAGIKNGDGLPGGGTTFAFPDVSGSPHMFDGTSFPNFAKAARDYRYAMIAAIATAQAGGSPTLPTIPVTIP
jgi:hypothetical protein